MGRLEGIGDQYLHRLADQLLPPVAEQPLRLRVDQRDTAVPVDAHDGVWCPLEEAGKQPISDLHIEPHPFRKVAATAGDGQ